MRDYKNNMDTLCGDVGTDVTNMWKEIEKAKNETNDAKTAGVNAIDALYAKVGSMETYAQKWGEIGEKIKGAASEFSTFYTLVSTTKFDPVTLEV